MEAIQTIEIDCAPMSPRPDHYLKGVLKGTGIEPVKESATLFGNWTFDFEHVDAELWQKSKPVFKERLSKLYDSGKIRYASW